MTLNPAVALAAHTELQRVLLNMLATPGCVSTPIRVEPLLVQALEYFPERSRADAQLVLHPANVERALHELQGHVAGAVQLERGELLAANAEAVADFHARLTGGARPSLVPVPSSTPSPLATTPAEGERKASNTRKRTATAVHDDELAEVLDLVGQKSIREQERQEQERNRKVAWE